MKIHLVYAFYPNQGRVDSPFCITDNLHKYLSERAEVKYDVWDSHSIPEGDPEAIFIGHPHYEHTTIVQQVFRRDIPYKARCTIHPLHTNRVEDNMPFDHISRKADKIFSICGPYWYDTIESTPFAHWKPKIMRLDMAVNSQAWPHRKAKFNDIGNRGIVYVGSDMPQKNLGLMYEIVRRMPDQKFRWYGGNGENPLAKLPNMQVIGWCDFNDKNRVQEICDFADFFLNTSWSDANPTTLLEFGLASGIIPICTETSGYWRDDSFVNISHNPDDAVQTIRHQLNRDSSDLLNRSLLNRSIAETKYTWDNFCGSVWNELVKLA